MTKKFDINDPANWRDFDWDAYDEELSVEIKSQGAVNRQRGIRLAWEQKDKEERKEHGQKSMAWRGNPKKVLEFNKKKIELGQYRDVTIYKELYQKTLTWKRFDLKVSLYKKLSEEYNIPLATVGHIAVNIYGCGFLVDPNEHTHNMEKIKKEWEQIFDKRNKKKQEEQQQRNLKKHWFTIEIISPGKGAENLYDYYNSLRTSNQKMPVPPSLVYYFRENNMNAQEIKKYCYDKNIYKGTDVSYWHKLAKFDYPWYSDTKSITYTFTTSQEAATFLSKIFNKKITDSWVREKSGLMKFGVAKGWIVRKVKKQDNQ